jgi:hypothetical protein
MIPTQTPSWAKNMQKLGPGVYLHKESLHISEAEICQHLGIKYSRENSKLIEQFSTKILRDKYPGIKVEVENHAGRRS